MEARRKQLKIVLLGQGVMAEAIVPVLKQLLGRESLYFYVKSGAKRHTNIQLPLGQLNTRKSVDYINYLHADCVILASWSEIIKPEYLEQLLCPVINCHPSLLPKYRGPNPYYAMILSGETEAGVTFHKIDSGIDTGPIILQSHAINIDTQDTWQSLRKKLVAVAVQMMPNLLNILIQEKKINGILFSQHSENQVDNNTNCNYYPRPEEQDFWLDWHLNAEYIDKQCRAQYKHYPLVTRFRGMKVYFQYGEVVANDVKQGIFDKAIPGQIIKTGLKQFDVKINASSQILRLYNPVILNMPLWQSAVLTPLLFRLGQCFDTKPVSSETRPLVVA